MRLLRGLMKCAHCGLTFIGTVAQGKRVKKLSADEREVSEVRGEHELRPYYMCNGKNGRERTKGPNALNCPSGHIRARELETLIWSEIEGFLNEPEGVIKELSSLLRERLGEGVGESELFKELAELRSDAAGKEAERGALYRLFRKGLLPETDLESQLGELRAEEVAVAERLEKVERAVEKAKDARSSLDGARAMLLALRDKVEAGGDSWGSRRRAVENLVAGIEIETHQDESRLHGKPRAFTIRITYRFEVPDLEDVVPLPYKGRTGHTTGSVLGLSLRRTHAGVSFSGDPFAATREAALELLRSHPHLMAKEIAAQVLLRTGRTISAASISRLRSAMQSEVAVDAEAEAKAMVSLDESE